MRARVTARWRDGHAAAAAPKAKSKAPKQHIREIESTCSKRHERFFLSLFAPMIESHAAFRFVLLPNNLELRMRLDNRGAFDIRCAPMNAQNK